MKSPLLDPFSEYKSIRLLKQKIPSGSIVETFYCFSGVVEMALCAHECFVVGHTPHHEVEEFWDEIQKSPEKVAIFAEKVNSLLGREELFETVQDMRTTFRNSSQRAAAFYVLNRCTDNHSISSGKLEYGGITPYLLHQLRSFTVSNFHIQLVPSEATFVESIMYAPKSHYRIIPMGLYERSYLSQTTGTSIAYVKPDHEALATFLLSHKSPWVILYNNHKDLFDIYKDSHIHMVDKYGRETTSRDECLEVLIANF